MSNKASNTPVQPGKERARHSDWQLIKRLAPYLGNDRRKLVLALFLAPLGVLADVVQPILLKVGIDDYIALGDLQGLSRVVAGFAVMVLLAWGIASLSNYMIQRVALRVLTRLRLGIFDHIMRQGSSFFDSRHAGSLMTRTINDVDAVYESLWRGIVQLLTNTLKIGAIVASMLYLDMELTLVSFVFAPVIYLIVGWFRRRLRPVSLKIRETLSALNGFFAERVYGMIIVRLYGAQAVSKARFDKLSHRYMRSYHRLNWLDASLYAVMDGMASLATAAVVWYAAIQINPDNGQLVISIGILVAFIDYLGRIFVPIRELSNQIATLQSSLAALEKIFGLMDVHQELPEGSATLNIPVQGNVRFEGLNFTYVPGRSRVLKDIDLEIGNGEVVALVGATGSGKSTIGKLLGRMYAGYEGAIRIDGHELGELTTRTVRDAVTVVHQDVWLMKGSVADNIRLDNRDMTDEQVIEVLKSAQAWDFVSALPEGIHAQVSEGGTNLSSGEKQLLSIARAMARRSGIVILDEATASVDSITERAIDRALESLFDSSTVLVIAHRLQTIRRADRIVVLHHGEIVEQGTHDSLMALGGRYKLLVETGFAL